MDGPMIAEGVAVLDRAVARHSAGPFQIKAAIAACQVQGSVPDWPQIAALYAGLYQHEPSPVVRLNHAVAVAETGDTPAAMAILSAIEADLADYQPFHAAKAELCFRSGQTAAAFDAYSRAIVLAPSPADAAFLTMRRSRLLT